MKDSDWPTFVSYALIKKSARRSFYRILFLVILPCIAVASLHFNAFATGGGVLSALRDAARCPISLRRSVLEFVAECRPDPGVAFREAGRDPGVSRSRHRTIAGDTCRSRQAGASGRQQCP